ncbi:MAG: hypothetical protein K8R89_01195 [Anaerolineae bacterium]|nr:hypothetical protein [Anaerolineae bacterium]
MVLAQVGVPDRSFDPQLRIYDDNGILLCQDTASTYYSKDAAHVHCILPTDGAYLLLVGTYAGASRITYGSYQLYVQRLNPAVNTTSLRFDTSVSGYVEMAATLDTYAFRAASGDQVSVEMSVSQASIDPEIRLYGTDGVKLCEAHALSTYADAVARISSCTLPFSGTYTLLAGDYMAGETGAYQLQLNCEGESCGFPLVLNEKIYLPLVLRSLGSTE